ncbi:MAG: hypothetical protein IT542_07430 [Rubellimicrobium sp.]|nr:hypothetical protein [Rubellimicrobium sp.]
MRSGWRTEGDGALPVAPRLTPAAGDLLAVAVPRLRRQRQVAQLLTRGGRGAEALESWIGLAGECLTEIARPQVLHLPLAAQPCGGAVRLGVGPITAGPLIAGPITAGPLIADPALAAGVAAGGQVHAALVTLGFAQEQAFARLGRDYAIHHVQSSLADEMLFALARTADRALLARHPGWGLHRIAVRTQEGCDGAPAWDAAQVQALLSLFAGGNPGVELTEAGFFRPLHSLLTLAVLRPDRVRASRPGPRTSGQTGGD